MEKEKNNSKNKKNSTGKTDNNNRNKIISPVKENKNNKEINDKGGNKNEYISAKNKSYNDEDSMDYDYENEEEEEDDEDYEYEDDKSNNTYEDKKVKQKNNNTVNNNKNQQNIKRKKLFFKSEKSRFDFCAKNNEENNNNIVVPEHITNLIHKKINSYILTKYMHPKIVDKMFINESIKKDNKIKNDEWIKFINDNIDSTNFNNHNSDEFINEFDNINQFILNKVNIQTESNNK